MPSIATWIWLTAGFLLAALIAHLASIAVATIRCRRPAPLPARTGAPAVSIIRPLCGIDNFAEETLRSSFTLDYPRYELIFCLARSDDPVAAIVRRLIAEYPQVPARLLIGDERISANPKLNNILKGWSAASHSWIVMADSNVLMPRDYIQRLIAAWRHDTGLVCSPPAACQPEGLWAEIEAAFLNGYQARWQYAAEAFGHGFAQGKTMLWRRADLEQAGGIRALGTEAAEDAAATKAVRKARLKVRLVDAPFGQPLGRRTASDVWNRQLRWARLRRASFLGCFLPELFAGGFFPLLAALTVAGACDYPLALAALAFLAVWYGAEMLLVAVAGWPLSARTPFVAMLRDVMLPALWIAAWRSRRFVWRGHDMRAVDGHMNSIATESTTAADIA